MSRAGPQEVGYGEPTINDDAVEALAEALHLSDNCDSAVAWQHFAAHKVEAALIYAALPEGWHLTNQPTADSAQEIERLLVAVDALLPNGLLKPDPELIREVRQPAQPSQEQQGNE